MKYPNLFWKLQRCSNRPEGGHRSLGASDESCDDGKCDRMLGGGDSGLYVYLYVVQNDKPLPIPDKGIISVCT